MSSVSSPNVAKFNIGGQRYEVSLSLLEQYPNSMLTKSVSRQWRNDSNSETFIERDGTMFRFVLVYLRDGKVTLPITESREAFLTDLKYYGVEVYEENICEKDGHKIKSTQSMKTAVEDLRDTIEKLEIESDQVQKEILCIELAIDFIQMFLNEVLTDNWNEGWNNLNEKLNDHPEALGHLDRLKVLADDDVVQSRVNAYLDTVGLQIMEYETHRGEYWRNGKRLFGVHCKTAMLELNENSPATTNRPSRKRKRLI